MRSPSFNSRWSRDLVCRWRPRACPIWPRSEFTTLEWASFSSPPSHVRGKPPCRGWRRQARRDRRDRKDECDGGRARTNSYPLRPCFLHACSVCSKYSTSGRQSRSLAVQICQAAALSTQNAIQEKSPICPQSRCQFRADFYPQLLRPLGVGSEFQISYFE